MRILTTIIVGFSGFLYAAPPEYMAAILASEQVVSLTSGQMDIIKVEQTARLRCPGGYQFLVSLGDFPDIESTVSLYTEDTEAGIKVQMIE